MTTMTEVGVADRNDDSSRGFTAEELDGFLAHYKRERLLATGQTPVATTVAKKAMSVRIAARVSGCETQYQLAQCLTTTADVQRLLHALVERRAMSSGSVRNHLWALQDFGRFSISNGWISTLAATKDLAPKANRKPSIEVYSGDELERFRSAARGRDLRWWALIVFLQETGCRVSEALALEWSWFRFEHPHPHVMVPKTKNGDEHVILLSQCLREQVFTTVNIEAMKTATKGRSGRPFHRPSTVHPFPWKYTTIGTMLACFCKITGLPQRGFHNFRHTVITQRLADGTPAHVVAKLAGHRSVQTTLGRYDHTTNLDYARYVN